MVQYIALGLNCKCKCRHGEEFIRAYLEDEDGQKWFRDVISQVTCKCVCVCMVHAGKQGGRSGPEVCASPLQVQVKGHADQALC